MNVAEIPLEQFVDVAASVAHGIAHVNCRVHFELGERTIHHTEPLSVVGMLVGDQHPRQGGGVHRRKSKFASSQRERKSRLQMPQSMRMPSPVTTFSTMVALPFDPLAST